MPISSWVNAALLLAAALSATRSVGASPDQYQDIETLLATDKIPSASVARIEHGKIVWARAWGQQGPGVAATTETLYNTASLAKPISAETVLRAAAAHGVSLDEPMSRWWVDPDLKDDVRHERLTPRIALTHRTGFSNWRSETGGRLTFKSAPGATVGYSGEGFEYLAHYAAKRFRIPFEQLARRYVFAPAKMNSTSYTERAWFAGRIAVPADGNGTYLKPSIRKSFLASDDMYTTASDYGRFLVGVAAGQGLAARGVADRERIGAVTRKPPCPSGPVEACPNQAGFGLGWDVAVFGRDRVLWHTGADLGEFTFAYIIPRTGEGAVILTNSAVGYKVILPLLERMGAHPNFVAFLKAQADE